MNIAESFYHLLQLLVDINKLHHVVQLTLLS